MNIHSMLSIYSQQRAHENNVQVTSLCLYASGHLDKMDYIEMHNIP